VVEPIGGKSGLVEEMEAEEKVRNPKENDGLYIAGANYLHVCLVWGPYLGPTSLLFHFARRL
jgi:hypothetical protein